MTIDGTNISDYGLRLISMNDYYNQPARKRVLTEPGYEAKDLAFESREPIITLFGEYADLQTMLTNIEAFKTKIKSALTHDYILIGHNLTFTGAIPKGIKSEIIRTAIKLKFTIVIIEP